MGWAITLLLVLVELSGGGVTNLFADETAAQNPEAPSPPPWMEARDRAIEQIVACSRSQDPFVRANAIEAAQLMPRRVVPMIQLGIQDANPAVRFAALVTIGKLRLTEMAPTAQRLTDDPSASVRAAALFAGYRCQQQPDISPFAAMLTSVNPTVRGNAAMLLGLMDDRGAVEMLKELAATPMPRANPVQEAIVRLQVAEAIVKLGDDSALNAIRASVYSQFDEVRVLAVSMLGGLSDRRMEKALAQLLLEPPIELQVAAAGTLTQLGRPEGLPVILQACGSPVPTVRAQAGITLGYFRSRSAAQALLALLEDPHQAVRLSAAAGILRATDQR